LTPPSGNEPGAVPAADAPAAENVGGGTKKEQTQAHRTAPDEPDAPLSCSERHARAQQHGSELWSPVRDEEAAGSNPVTPTSIPAGQRPYPFRGGAFGLARTATKYRNGAHRGDSPGLRSASLVAVELVFAEISNVIDTSTWRRIRMITRGWTSRSKSSVAHVRLAS
jgi:hypothetical protein